MEYIAYLHKDKDSDYGVSFFDFPGVVTAGRTLEEARRMAPEALALHIKGMQEDGENIPAPSTLDDLEGDPAMKDAKAIMVVPALVGQEKLKRVNITARESQLEKINVLAKEAGMSRSAYMVHSCISGERAVHTARKVTSRRRVAAKTK